MLYHTIGNSYNYKICSYHTIANWKLFQLQILVSKICGYCSFPPMDLMNPTIENYKYWYLKYVDIATVLSTHGIDESHHCKLQILVSKICGYCYCTVLSTHGMDESHHCKVAPSDNWKSVPTEPLQSWTFALCRVIGTPCIDANLVLPKIAIVSISRLPESKQCTYTLQYLLTEEVAK